jgi:hypothetical protein
MSVAMAFRSVTLKPAAASNRTVSLTSYRVASELGSAGRLIRSPAAPGDAQVTNEQVFLLRTLYAQCGPALQKRFPISLMKQLTLETAAVVVHSVIDIGHLSALGKALREKKLDSETRRAVWFRVREKLATEAHRFTADDLAEVDSMRAAEVKRIPKSQRPEPPVTF